MTQNLTTKLNDLKDYSSNLKVKKLNKAIYALDVDEESLKKLDSASKIYMHVKFHNALAFKKPFAPLEKIKEKHDLLVKYLENHKVIDELDY